MTRFNHLTVLVLRLCFALSLLLFVFWVYWPGHTGPMLLDDYSSVKILGAVEQNEELVLDYVFGDGSGPLGRPVSIASFVLEKLLIGDGASISKQVNIVLHLVNGALVAWLLLIMLRAERYPAHSAIAILLAMIWVLSPLHVSTVLYVVQRMAMLSTTFMLLACISYCRWRELLLNGEKNNVLLLLVPVFGIIGLFSKENAVVIIPTLLLIEALWFQCRDADGNVDPLMRTVTFAAIGTGGACLALFLALGYTDLLNSYQHRYFTLPQRLLTESRILWDYLGQLVWPDVSRMGIYHDDVAVSTSLSDPGTTSPALIGWMFSGFALLLALFFRIGRYLALGCLWFMVGHALESTVLPLELYFEHRNYFPSIGLILIPAVLLGHLLKCWPPTKIPLFVYFGAYAFWLATLTSSQVEIWSSRPLLALNHINGHPDSFRANTDMAVIMADLGELESARDYSRRAFALNRGKVDRYGDYLVRDLALSCIADEPVTRERINVLGTNNEARPLSSVTTLLTLVRLLQDNACPDFDRLSFANRMAEIFIVEDFRSKASPNIYFSLAVLENSLMRYDNALRYAEQFLVLSPDNINGLLMKLHFTTALGKVDEARAVISQLQGMDSAGRLTVGEQQTLALYLENS